MTGQRTYLLILGVGSLLLLAAGGTAGVDGTAAATAPTVSGTPADQAIGELEAIGDPERDEPGQSSADRIVVEPGESIQTAVDRASRGTTVEVRPGTYAESVVLGTDRLTLVAPDGATIDGGVTVAADGVIVEGFEIIEGDAGVTTDGTLANIEVRDVTVSDSADYGVDIAAERATIVGVDAVDNGDTGIRVDLTASGSLAMADVTVERSASGYGDDGHGVEVIGGGSVTVRSTDVRDVGGNGIIVSAGDARDRSVEVAGVTISEASDGLVVGDSGSTTTTDVTIERVETSGHVDYGVDVDADSVTVTDVVARENGDTGVLVDPDSDGTATVTNVTVERSTSGYSDDGHGVHVLGGGTVEVSGVDAFGNGGTGVVVESDEARSQSVTVRDSLVEGSDSDGIHVTSGDDADATLAGLTVAESGDDGLAVTAADVVVRNTDVTDSGDSAVRVTSTPDGTVRVADVRAVRSRSSYSADGYGVAVTGGTNVTLEAVEGIDNEGAALLVAGGDARGQRIAIDGVESLGSGDDGIRVEGSSGDDSVTISDVVSEGADGVGVWAVGSDIAVTNASVEESGDAGVRVTSAERGSVSVTETDVSRSGGDGVAVVDGGTVNVTETTVESAGERGIELTAEDTRGQAIVLERTVVEGAGSSGAFVAGSAGDDRVSVAEAVARGNGEYGFRFDRVEAVEITDTRADGNADGALSLGALDRESATIRNSFDDYSDSESESESVDSAGQNETTDDGDGGLTTWLLLLAGGLLSVFVLWACLSRLGWVGGSGSSGGTSNRSSTDETNAFGGGGSASDTEVFDADGNDETKVFDPAGGDESDALGSDAFETDDDSRNNG